MLLIPGVSILSKNKTNSYLQYICSQTSVEIWNNPDDVCRITSSPTRWNQMKYEQQKRAVARASGHAITNEGWTFVCSSGQCELVFGFSLGLLPHCRNYQWVWESGWNFLRLRLRRRSCATSDLSRQTFNGSSTYLAAGFCSFVCCVCVTQKKLWTTDKLAFGNFYEILPLVINYPAI